MANQINLLPKELIKKAGGKLTATIRKVSTSLLAIFVLAFLVLGGYLFFLTNRVSRAKVNQEVLKASLQNLEQTEQSVVLIKDRLKFARSIRSLDSVSQNVESFESLYSELPSDVRLTEAKIFPDKTEVTLFTTSSSSLVIMIDSLTSNKFYKKITIKSFGFNPSAGYLINLELIQ